MSVNVLNEVEVKKRELRLQRSTYSPVYDPIVNEKLKFLRIVKKIFGCFYEHLFNLLNILVDVFRKKEYVYIHKVVLGLIRYIFNKRFNENRHVTNVHIRKDDFTSHT